MADIIASFGPGSPYRWASNFGPGKVTLGNLTFPRREHGYQASKSLDLEVRRGFTDPAMTAGQAKRAGQLIQLRPDWERAKKKVMLLVVLSAFTQNPDLGQKLLATGEAVLVEGNTWGDEFWGAVPWGQHTMTAPLWDGNKLSGFNWLGRILMITRDIIKAD